MAFAQKDYLCLYSSVQSESSSWEVSQVRKITFSSDAINVHLWQDGDLHGLSYGKFRKITFEEQPLPDSGPTGIQVMETTGMTLRYDAARKTLRVSGLNGNGTIQVYSIGGTLSMSSTVDGGQSEVSLADIPEGLYIVKVSDGEETKSVKIQIK